MMLSSVVLPEPEGPITAVSSPGFSWRLTPSRALTVLASRPYTLLTPINSIMFLPPLNHACRPLQICLSPMDVSLHKQSLGRMGRYLIPHLREALNHAQDETAVSAQNGQRFMAVNQLEGQHFHCQFIEEQIPIVFSLQPFPQMLPARFREAIDFLIRLLHLGNFVGFNQAIPLQAAQGLIDLAEVQGPPAASQVLKTAFQLIPVEFLLAQQCQEQMLYRHDDTPYIPGRYILSI